MARGRMTDGNLRDGEHSANLDTEIADKAVSIWLSARPKPDAYMRREETEIQATGTDATRLLRRGANAGMWCLVEDR